MSTPPINAALPNELRDMLQSSLQLRVQYSLNNLSNAMRLVKQRAGMYEKLMVFDGAVIAISITFIGYLVGHPHPSRIWLSLVLASWLTLLLSMLYSWNHNFLTHQSVTTLSATYQVLTQHYILTSASIMLARVPPASISSAAGSVDVNALLAGAEKSQEDAVSKANELSAKAHPFGQKAVYATLIGLILMLVFASIAIFTALR